MSIRFCPLASGSSGNSIYIGVTTANGFGATNILIDAGMSGKSIESGLNSIGVSGKEIDGLLITHEHSDHISGVGVMSRRYDIPVYATEKTWRYFNRHNILGAIKEHNKMIITPNEPCIINDIEVLPFEIPHDSIEPVGYSLKIGGRKISVATDIGHTTDIIKRNIADSDILLIESNHDIDMLTYGRYPAQLKKRVLGSNGHLSNVSCGELLSEIMSDKLRYIYLGHLSEENNRPLLAMDTVSGILSQYQFKNDYKLILADRYGVSQLLELDSTIG